MPTKGIAEVAKYVSNNLLELTTTRLVPSNQLSQM